MVNQKVAAVVCCWSAFVVFPAIAEPCQESVIISREGYATVRSAPRVRKNNIVGTLPLGSTVEPISVRSNWVNIRSPYPGWIKQNHGSKLSCDEAFNLLLEKGLPTLSQLGEQAILGNGVAAEAFLRMSRGLGGLVAETYLKSLKDWTARNPSFLVAVLQRQPSTIRYSVLDVLNTDLGTKQSPERLKFEQFLRTLPPNHLIVQDWKRL